MIHLFTLTVKFQAIKLFDKKKVENDTTGSELYS
jgi:hypothetical protein